MIATQMRIVPERPAAIAALLAKVCSAQAAWEVFDARKLTGLLELPSPRAGAEV